MSQPVEVFRAVGRRACEERAFMLMAVGIDSIIDAAPDGHALLVESTMREHALHHLWQYEHERRAVPRPPVSLTPQPGAWHGSVIYVLVLLLVPVALAQGWLPDPYQYATLQPTLVREGEWWRIFTALTLHWDAAHLLGNAGAGALLGYSAAQIWGSARAWLLILVAAVAANLVESLVARSDYVSAGASTAVFAALGLIAAFAWRSRRQRFGAPWARWAPLIAGAVILGLFGAGSNVPVAGMPRPDVMPFDDEGVTNVLSHVLGFICGAVTGALAATPIGIRLVRALPAPVATALVLLPIGIAWLLSLF